jgi:hypothetical protein
MNVIILEPFQTHSKAELLAVMAVIDVTFTHWIYSIMHVVSSMTSRSALRLLARVIPILYITQAPRQLLSNSFPRSKSHHLSEKHT